jgi:hypothetical protein
MKGLLGPFQEVYAVCLKGSREPWFKESGETESDF